MALKSEREVLNHLIESCRDGERGFITAAEHLSDPNLRSLFMQLSAERARCAEELQPHARRLGGPAAADGSTVAALHRKWIDVKSALTHDHDRAIVVEAARGDGATVNAFKDAIAGSLPPDTRDIVERQYEAIQQEHDWLTVQARHVAN
jgi:uncharacterized protein (TIGR02284 family)